MAATREGSAYNSRVGWLGFLALTADYPSFENAQNNEPESRIETGSVSTQAMSRLRTVAHCRPEWLAAMVPATPDDSTWVVLTGSPKASAAPMVTMAVISAAAPWA